LVKGCGKNEATPLNNAESGSESDPVPEMVRRLASANSDGEEAKVQMKASKENLTNSLAPRQIRGAPNPPTTAIMSNAIKMENSLRIGIIKHKEYSILEKIASEVRLILASTQSRQVTDSGKIYMESKFRVGWSPMAFMSRQFVDSPLASIGSVIVLSGTSLNAQATTCKEYLQKHWPTTCMVLLKCLQEGMKFINGVRDITRGTSPDLTS